MPAFNHPQCSAEVNVCAHAEPGVREACMQLVSWLQGMCSVPAVRSIAAVAALASRSGPSVWEAGESAGAEPALAGSSGPGQRQPGGPTYLQILSCCLPQGGSSSSQVSKRALRTLCVNTPRGHHRRLLAVLCFGGQLCHPSALATVMGLSQIEQLHSCLVVTVTVTENVSSEAAIMNTMQEATRADACCTPLSNCSMH